METQRRSVGRIVDEQVKKWQYQASQTGRSKDVQSPVVTISREPGSGGRLVAERVSKLLDYDLFHQEVVHEMAEDARISVRFMETLDERGLTTLDNWIASLVDERYLWPDQYMHHLMKVIGTMGRHGQSVIVGRGANFILQPSQRVSVRLTAPFTARADHVAREFSVSEKEAGRRIVQTESRRRAFVRKYFNASISDAVNYDLMINTDAVGIEGAAQAISAAVRARIEKKP